MNEIFLLSRHFIESAAVTIDIAIRAKEMYIRKLKSSDLMLSIIL